MKNEIDQTVERIGQLPDIYVWKFPDGTRIKIIAFSDVDVKRWADGHYDGYIDESYSLYSQGFHYAPSTEEAAYTQLKADLATAKQGLVDLAESCDCGHLIANHDGLDECEICDCVTITNLAQQTLDKIGKE